MQNQARKEGKKKVKNKNYSDHLLRTYYENHSAELQFIVPWIQYEKSNLRNCKQLIVDDKN